ncbi:Hypothetical protein A7982_10330 [Minicystis rosea]|nr:Hypothetical protein A7982_10330 [Minicystis rosea]
MLHMDALEATIKGPEGARRFALIEQEERGQGCAGSYDQEQVRIAMSELVIEDLTFHEPLLFAACASQPPRIELVEWNGFRAPNPDAVPRISFVLQGGGD